MGEFSGIAGGTVQSAEIAQSTPQSAEIAEGRVQSTKIAGGTVQSTKIAESTVHSSERPRGARLSLQRRRHDGYTCREEIEVGSIVRGGDIGVLDDELLRREH